MGAVARLGRVVGIAALAIVVLAACSPAADGTIPAASRFGASEVPCAETEGFADLDDALLAAWDAESVCWTREGPADLGSLVTDIRNAIAPIQDVAVFADPVCGPWSDNLLVEECAIGGVVSDDPYTIVSVLARPVYTAEDLALLKSGKEVEAATVEIHIQTVELGGSIDQWERDKEGTHID